MMLLQSVSIQVLHLHVYDRKVKLCELENYRFTIVSLLNKNETKLEMYPIFCNLSLFISNKPQTANDNLI